MRLKQVLLHTYSKYSTLKGHFLISERSTWVGSRVTVPSEAPAIEGILKGMGEAELYIPFINAKEKKPLD